ncbi:hypothetical protein SCLCIDRAFT_1044533 [Scleroderma citrinum Foug A]|uniref:Uncharacterized protein n=1 Tax=Scleroderma citrinum Foug A TaxID=1036808 RepID=A0A0C2ZAQ6_9AGAM|nr:hypothetical protein SCLCIDRAFT_1044533 [Scleroderma citrinum Foug A]
MTSQPLNVEVSKGASKPEAFVAKRQSHIKEARISTSVRTMHYGKKDIGGQFPTPTDAGVLQYPFANVYQSSHAGRGDPILVDSWSSAGSTSYWDLGTQGPGVDKYQYLGELTSM